MSRKLQLCLTMDLGDYNAFEQLAKELGMDVNAWDLEIVKVPEPKAKAKKTKRRKPVYMYTEVWDAIKAVKDVKDKTYDQIRDELVPVWGGKHIPSTETIRRVLADAIPRPNRPMPPELIPKNVTAIGTAGK